MNLFTKFWLIIVAVCQLSCNETQVNDQDNWCNEVDLSMYTGLREIESSSDWFHIFEVGKDVFAIAEPFNYEEVISFLILGEERALLFDTGMGIDSISRIVAELTALPVTVLNSHTHHDHIGGNSEFDQILALDTKYTRHWANNGWSHDIVKDEVSPQAFCHHKYPSLDTAGYHIKPFSVSQFIEDGHILDLGNREIEVISIPGHTPDAIAIIDREYKYLWTGDTFYEATIWLFYEGTDLKAYEKSISKLAELSDSLDAVFPSHNRPIAEPVRLQELAQAFEAIASGEAQAISHDGSDPTFGDPDNELRFEFEHFSFLIRNEYLSVFE